MSVLAMLTASIYRLCDDLEIAECLFTFNGSISILLSPANKLGIASLSNVIITYNLLLLITLGCMVGF